MRRFDYRHWPFVFMPDSETNCRLPNTESPQKDSDTSAKRMRPIKKSLAVNREAFNFNQLVLTN